MAIGRGSWVCGLLGLALSCGSSDDGLFGPAPGSGGTAGQAASGGGGLSGSSGGGTAGNADAGSDAPAGGQGGSPGGAGGVGATSGTGGGPSGVGTVPCGSALCGLNLGASCCFTSNKGLYCSNAGRNNPCSCGTFCDKLQIDCDGPEDCPTGQLCCGTKVILSQKYEEVKCRTSCQVPARDVREVCHIGGEPCANGNACVADLNLPGGYASCAP